jgi:hypothetical protein
MAHECRQIYMSSTPVSTKLGLVNRAWPVVRQLGSAVTFFSAGTSAVSVCCLVCGLHSSARHVSKKSPRLVIGSKFEHVRQ